MRRLLWISMFAVFGCNRTQTTADAQVVAPPASTTAAPATATTTAPTPTNTALPPLGGTVPTAHPTVIRLPDGGLAPAPEGGAFVMPTLPSGFVMPTALPSGIPTTLPSGFPTFPPPPAPSH
jgi:hypothetical protein